MPALNRRRPPVDALVSAQRARQLTLRTLEHASRARRQLFLLVPLLVATLLAYRYRQELFGLDAPVRVAAALVMIGLGWALARDIGRFLAPALFRRMDAA